MIPITLGEFRERVRNFDHLPDNAKITVEDDDGEKWLTATTTYGDYARACLTDWER